MDGAHTTLVLCHHPSQLASTSNARFCLSCHRCVLVLSLVELEVESIRRLALSVSDRRAPRQLPLVTCVAPTGLARIMEYEEGRVVPGTTPHRRWGSGAAHGPLGRRGTAPSVVNRPMLYSIRVYYERKGRWWSRKALLGRASAHEEAEL
jgi:hypothetical protein